jgi:hypothetical protein
VLTFKLKKDEQFIIAVHFFIPETLKQDVGVIEM